MVSRRGGNNGAPPVRMPSMGGAMAKGSWVTLPGGWAAERVEFRQYNPPRRENKQEAGLKEEKGVGTMGLKPEHLGRTSSRGGCESLPNQELNRISDVKFFEEFESFIKIQVRSIA